VESLITGGGLLIFLIYTTVSALLVDPWDFETEGRLLLSPLFERLITPGWMPDFVSPALLILWATAGFRTTCYYYRRTYYNARRPRPGTMTAPAGASFLCPHALSAGSHSRSINSRPTAHTATTPTTNPSNRQLRPVRLPIRAI
jgi:hypothetical protein